MNDAMNYPATQPPTLVFRVDRTRALMRGVWRIAIALALLAMAGYWDAHWGLLWRTQKLVFIAFGVVWLILVSLGLAAGISGVRWLLMSVWRGKLEMTVSPERVSIHAPPFMRRELDGRRLRVEVEEGIDRDLIDELPDDAFLPHLRHPDAPEDLTLTIQKFSGLSSEEMTHRLRPYLRDGHAVK